MEEKIKKVLETEFIRGKIFECESVDALKDNILPMLKTQKEEWSKKINEILTNNNFQKAEFAELCGVSKVAVNKWCNGSIPKNRETFLRIGLAAKYDVENMNTLLQRYGKYPALYCKSLEDCICMFVISKENEDERIDKFNYILGKIKNNIIRDENCTAENPNTTVFDARISKIQDEEELEAFITQNISVFSYAFHRFYAEVKVYIEHNYNINNIKNSYEMALAQGWTSSLRQCVSEIKQNKWYPIRRKIISLGMHLSLDHEQIDELLKLAHMEPLCAKNIFESVIIFILDKAATSGLLNEQNEDFDPDSLCIYAKEIFSELDLPDAASFFTEIKNIDKEW